MPSVSDWDSPNPRSPEEVTMEEYRLLGVHLQVLPKPMNSQKLENTLRKVKVVYHRYGRGHIV